MEFPQLFDIVDTSLIMLEGLKPENLMVGEGEEARGQILETIFGLFWAFVQKVLELLFWLTLPLLWPFWMLCGFAFMATIGMVILGFYLTALFWTWVLKTKLNCFDIKHFESIGFTSCTGDECTADDDTTADDEDYSYFY